jgi:hypothetical protein
MCTIGSTTGAYVDDILTMPAEIERLRADNARMSECLCVITAAHGVGTGSLKTAAYDVALNRVTADVLRARFARRRTTSKPPMTS